MFRHVFQFIHLSLALLAHLTNDLLQARFNRPHQHSPHTLAPNKERVFLSEDSYPTPRLKVPEFDAWG
jgi:hypothetical protein